MERDEIYREMLRIFRENGYNDFIIAVRDGRDFLRYIPFRDVIFSGKDRVTIRLTNGKKESIRYEDIVEIKNIESLGD
ncbi:MAG: hypothetical protein QXP36_08650 [Conexivisphaerales archaeon]